MYTHVIKKKKLGENHNKFIVISILRIFQKFHIHLKYFCIIFKSLFFCKNIFLSPLTFLLLS